jgi:Trk-type K+ transport system membrane component
MVWVALFFMVLNFVGAAIMGAIENWDYTNSFYFLMSASTTSGYGNVAPNTSAGKWFISFYQLLGIGTLFYFIAMLGMKEENRYEPLRCGHCGKNPRVNTDAVKLQSR